MTFDSSATCLAFALLILGLSGCGGETETPPSDVGTGGTPAAVREPGAVAAVEHHYFHADETPHAAEWGYAGEIGPEHWGDLSPDYVLARSGQRQSPIDIRSPEDATLPAIEFRYEPAKIDLVYNGHTVQETEEAGSAIVVDGHAYALRQFHFHAPSEHTVNGEHHPMEMHLVHQDESGRVAVVAVFIDAADEENAAFAPIWDYLPTEANKELRYAATVDATSLLPEERSYFAYDGSFTTPPCTESVEWFVLTEPVSLGRTQIDRFRAIVSGNNRPVQPLNGRVVERSVP